MYLLLEGEALTHDEVVSEEAECPDADVAARQNGAVPNGHHSTAVRTEEVVVGCAGFLEHFCQLLETFSAVCFFI